MRLSEIAARLADLFGSDDDAAAELHGVLRSPAMKALFKFTPGEIPKSPGYYRPIEILRARVLLAGQSCGLSVTELAYVNDALNKPVPPVKGGRVPTHLEELARGADWWVRIRYVEDQSRQRQAFVSIASESDFADARASERRAHAALDAVHHTTEIGHLFIRASDLIRPLLPLLDQD